MASRLVLTIEETRLVLATGVTSSSGESNTAANVGGEKEVFRDKVGAVLNFRTLKEGAGVTITQNADDLEIAASAAGDVLGPASSVDSELALYDGTTGKLLKGGSGITNTGSGELNGRTLTDIPTAAQKLALDNAAGTPAAGNPFILDDDARLSDARTPTAHVTTHHSGGSDPLVHDSIAGSGSNTHAQIDSHVASTANPHSVTAAQAGAIPITEKAAANGVATLDGSGLLLVGQVPPLAITSTFQVASQVAQLALTAERGDLAVRTDEGKTYSLQVEPASVFGNWVELPAEASLHASTHSDGGTDELDLGDLGSTSAAGANLSPLSDGAGGVTWAAAVPAAHAPTHSEGGSDELDVADLGSTSAGAAGEIPAADGVGGVDWVTAAGDIDESNVYYVGKHGSDSNDGKSIARAFLTIGAATAAATAETPSASNRFSIVIHDAGIYDQNVLLPAYVDLDAPAATIQSVGAGFALSVGEGSAVQVYEVIQDTGSTAVVRRDTSGASYVHVGTITLGATGFSSGISHLGTTTDSVLQIKAKTILVGDGRGLAVNAAGHVHFDIEDIYLTQNGGIGIDRTLAGSSIGRVTHILELGAPTGTTAINAAAGRISARVDTIQADTAWNVAAGAELDLFTSDVIGTRTETGTIRLTEVGVVSAHASQHQDGGSDEVGTATPAANAIPKADGSGLLDGWISSASDAVQGKIELATQAEVNTGTDTTRAVTPATLAGTTVTPEDHASTHLPGGGDALTTGAAVGLDSSSTNLEGGAVAFARSNHTHAIDSTNGAITTVNAGDAAAPGSGTGFSLRDHQHAVATATAVELTDSTNAEGAGTDLARATHTHAHGNRGGGALHALTAATGAGFQPQSNRSAVVPPVGTDDSAAGYSVGSLWVDTALNNAFICVDDTATLAVWDPIDSDALLASTGPADVTKAAAVVGVGTTAARADHKHDVTTAAPSTMGTANAEGSATSLARSDHVHDHGSQTTGTHHAVAIPAGANGFLSGADKSKLDGVAAGAAALTAAAPVDVTKAAAVVGVALDAARADHKHDISTAAASTLDSGSTNTEGAATSLARSDHTHLIDETGTVSTIQPDDTAADGSASGFARKDHTHAIVGAAPSQGIGGSNAEGASTSFSRADHDHTIRTTTGPTDLTVAAIADGQLVERSGTTLAGVAKAGIDSDAIHDNVTAEISAITAKGTVARADLVLIEDSAAANAKKSVEVEDLIVQPHGGLAAENQGTGLTLTLISPTWYQYVQWEANVASVRCTPDHTTDDITIDEAGTYHLVCSGCLETNNAANRWQIEFFKNGFRIAGGTRITIPTGAGTADAFPFTVNKLDAAAVNDVYDLRIRCLTAAGTVIRIRDANFTVVRVA